MRRNPREVERFKVCDFATIGKGLAFVIADGSNLSGPADIDHYDFESEMVAPPDLPDTG